MNPNAILALISDLYAQLCAAQDRITELEAQLGDPDQSAESEEEPTRLRPRDGGS